MQLLVLDFDQNCGKSILLTAAQLVDYLVEVRKRDLMTDHFEILLTCRNFAKIDCLLLLTLAFFYLSGGGFFIVIVDEVVFDEFFKDLVGAFFGRCIGVFFEHV